MTSKYNLTAVAVASMAAAAAGDAMAKQPGGPGPDPAFPTVKELACAAACEYPFWDAYWMGGIEDLPGVCSVDAEGDFLAEAVWADTIGAEMADGATQYAGGLEMEFVFEPYCGFGEFIEGEWTGGVDLFAARQFEYDLDLGMAEGDCDGEYCYSYWEGEPATLEDLYGAYAAAHDKACADEGGYSVMDGEFYLGPPPGYEDFEVSLKHTAPGKAGRQDHPVVTADCYDISFIFPEFEN